ncbi:MAG: methyltransferase domain-containing protein [Chloroflexi bacterium]|nr:methyltransferase domain-containing protein [Chloroflexota bacterium]
MQCRRRVIQPLLRFAFHLFYNPFAFTYDFVSAVVSRGHWRAWTRAAIPRITGTRVLEVPCGTGNLLLDLIAAGYTPVGVDLSPWMIRITRSKILAKVPSTPLRSAQDEPSQGFPLVRARVQRLPFPPRAFDTVIMTFPPELIYDPEALAEFRRVLDDQGRLIWVDAGRLLPFALWSRVLNRALDAVGGGDQESAHRSFAERARELLAGGGFEAQTEWVRDDASIVAVVTATKA